MGLRYQNLCNNYKIDWQIYNIYENNWRISHYLIYHIFENFPTYTRTGKSFYCGYFGYLAL